MASTAANALITNLLNYNGRFITTGQKAWPFATLLGLRRIAAGEESPFRSVGSMKFNMSVTNSLDAASQSAVTENDTLSAPTSRFYAPTQVTNYCQPFYKGLVMSEMKKRDLKISGQAILGDIMQLPTMQDQLNMHIKQIKKDYNYSIIRGTGQDGSSSSATAFQIGGLYTGISTNKKNAEGAALSKDLIQKILITSCKDNGAEMNDPLILAGAWQINVLNDLYGLQLRSESIGGVDLQYLILPMIGKTAIMYDHDVPDGVLILADMSFIDGVSNDRPGMAQIGVRELPQAGTGDSMAIEAYLGIDYGHESMHGALYGLADS